MKEAENKPASSFAGWALGGMAVAVVALTGLVFWLKTRTEDMERKLDDSIAQYEEMKRLKARVTELVARAPKEAQTAIDASEIATFLSAKANQFGISGMRINHTTPPRSGGWREIATMITLQGSRDQTIPRGPFVNFLAAVERERPYLKSKDLTLNFKESDLSNATVTISYFKRE
ncbi:MAG: hypothetical protein HYY16_19165 [Planctomycetes bacterium]|nr:hypothetical protein [Planctomycetota bacterium]